MPFCKLATFYKLTTSAKPLISCIPEKFIMHVLVVGEVEAASLRIPLIETKNIVLLPSAFVVDDGEVERLDVEEIFDRMWNLYPWPLYTDI